VTASNIEVLPDSSALARRVAHWLTDLALTKSGTFAIALSGGSTPRALYQTLAEPEFLRIFPWQNVNWFWGDERFVPHSDVMSNYRMASDALLSHAPIPLAQIHPIPTVGVTPEEAAQQYAKELQSFYGAERFDPKRPLFDVMLLGLGEDGHTASLVPGSPALGEREHWTAVTDMAGHTRITLTYPALESSAHTAFLVSGTTKHSSLQRVRAGDTNLPAARVHPMGDLHFFTDSAAAGCAG
jgi:6-phosphogluconolactonase